MFKTLLLATATTALVASPAAAHDYRWDYHRYHRDNGSVLAGALLGAVAGVAIASSSDRYDDGYGYPAYGYGYPTYGYGYGYGYPSYGYPSYGYAYPGYAYPSYGYGGTGYGLTISIGGGDRYRGYYGERYRR